MNSFLTLTFSLCFSNADAYLSQEKWRDVAAVEARLLEPTAEIDLAAAIHTPIAAALAQLPPLPDASLLSWFTNTTMATQQARSPALAEWLSAAAMQPVLRRSFAFCAFLTPDSLPSASKPTAAFLRPDDAADEAVAKALCLALEREAATAM